MIVHKGATFSATGFWIAACAWALPRAAAAGPLSADVRGYDWPSLGYAALLGLLGGGLALIVALASDKRVVWEVLGESLRNATVSPIAGAVAYVGLEAASAAGWYHAPPMTRFLVLVGAGWAGIPFFVLVRDTAGKVGVEVAAWVVRRSTPGAPPP